MSIKRRLNMIEEKLIPSNEVTIFVELEIGVSKEERIAKAWQKHLDNGGSPEDKPLYFMEIDPRSRG